MKSNTITSAINDREGQGLRLLKRSEVGEINRAAKAYKLRDDFSRKPRKFRIGKAGK